MKLWKFIKMMLFVTTMAVVYVHLQMQIFDLAYQAKIKEKQLQDLTDDNGSVHVKILKLKSANYLGQELLDEDSTLEFISNDRILSLVAAEHRTQDNVRVISLSEKKSTNPLSGLISLVHSQSEAEITDRR